MARDELCENDDWSAAVDEILHSALVVIACFTVAVVLTAAAVLWGVWRR